MWTEMGREQSIVGPLCFSVSSPRHSTSAWWTVVFQSGSLWSRLQKAWACLSAGVVEFCWKCWKSQKTQFSPDVLAYPGTSRSCGAWRWWRQQLLAAPDRKTGCRTSWTHLLWADLIVKLLFFLLFYNIILNNFFSIQYWLCFFLSFWPRSFFYTVNAAPQGRKIKYLYPSFHKHFNLKKWFSDDQLCQH